MTRSGSRSVIYQHSGYPLEQRERCLMNQFKRTGHESRFFMCGLCIRSCSISDLCVPFCKRTSCNGKDRTLKFLFGTEWRPSNDKFGILPMIVASIYVTCGAILIGVPIALFTSVFMARYCPKKIYNATEIRY